ncbi:thioesterase family protein [Nitrospirillum sp. BR 11163]|uniref:acyl-CoA thioesterase n=1 Tax=Nitrospirillum sp. BR 11163 TaxID=3104323 RepID=UPI002AFFBD25|nr:thioesterase family protein [Nitrospirillum sp. BR 11163]MEA1677725.1 thioesterase family protein [Nitrospirillum sp. BR 11163]
MSVSTQPPQASSDAADLPFDLAAAASYRFWTDERVRFNDLDPVGHVNNNAFGVYFESGRVALHQALRDKARFDGHAIVMRKITIDYLAEITYPNAVRVGTRLARLGRTSWTTASALFVGTRCHATALSVSVLVDAGSHRPAPIPDDLRPVMESFL